MSIPKRRVQVQAVILVYKTCISERILFGIVCRVDAFVSIFEAVRGLEAALVVGDSFY